MDAKVAYTRQSVQERAEKWDAIEAFEAYKAAKSSSKTLHPPKHRGLCASVRPQQGAEALVSFVCKPRDGGKSEIGGTRVSVIAGEEHDEKWKQVLSREVLDMRRGERIEADIDDQLKLDCCLHAVRVSRQLAPVDAEIYKGHGTVSTKRMEAPKPGGIRPQFGGTATIRLVRAGGNQILRRVRAESSRLPARHRRRAPMASMPARIFDKPVHWLISTQVIADDDRDDDALFKASESVDPQKRKSARAASARAGIAVLAMRPGEGHRLLRRGLWRPVLCCPKSRFRTFHTGGRPARCRDGRRRGRVVPQGARRDAFGGGRMSTGRGVFYESGAARRGPAQGPGRGRRRGVCKTQ